MQNNQMCAVRNKIAYGEIFTYDSIQIHEAKMLMNLNALVQN